MFYKKTLVEIAIQWNKTFQKYKKFYEEKINDMDKHINQLEKRINSIADYIQGPYTKQINQNFAEIQYQIDMLKPITNAKELAKHFPQIKQKDKKCSGSKQSKK